MGRRASLSIKDETHLGYFEAYCTGDPAAEAQLGDNQV